MKKTLAKKLQLSRETLRHLHGAQLQEAVGGATATCPQRCGSDAPTCINTCFCTGDGCL
jgi:hypothetical protein